MDANSELQKTLATLARAHKGAAHPGVDVTPACAFGAVVDQRLKDMEQRLEEVKSRLNGLIFLVTGAVVVEIVMRLLG